MVNRLILLVFFIFSVNYLLTNIINVKVYIKWLKYSYIFNLCFNFLLNYYLLYVK